MKIQNMTSSRGNKVPNQFIIFDGDTIYFQSYDSIIVKRTSEDGERVVYLDERYWDYSRTTGKYRNEFLRETKAQTQKKIDAGIYKLADLNQY